MQILALGHYSRTGKDTVANYVMEWFAQNAPGIRVQKVSFFRKAKELCHELFSWAGIREPEFYETPEGELARKQVLPLLGMTPVQLWVRFGDSLRQGCYAGIWSRYFVTHLPDADVLVLTDLRYPDEVEELRKLSSILVKVVRPGFEPLDTPPDRALQNFTGWDHVIGRTGTLAELKDCAAVFASELLRRHDMTA